MSFCVYDQKRHGKSKENLSKDKILLYENSGNVLLHDMKIV